MSSLTLINRGGKGSAMGFAPRGVSAESRPSIVTYNLDGVSVQDQFFISEADDDAYLHEQQALVDGKNT